jgi:hypothetical protein
LKLHVRLFFVDSPPKEGDGVTEWNLNELRGFICQQERKLMPAMSPHEAQEMEFGWVEEKVMKATEEDDEQRVPLLLSREVKATFDGMRIVRGPWMFVRRLDAPRDQADEPEPVLG